MTIQFVSSLEDEELLRRSDDIAAAMIDSSIIDDSPLPLLYLSLLALCNHERVVRTLPPQHASHPVTAVARERQPRRRPTSTRRKSSGAQMTAQG
jgi:hypothetical protein